MLWPSAFFFFLYKTLLYLFRKCLALICTCNILFSFSIFARSPVSNIYKPLKLRLELRSNDNRILEVFIWLTWTTKEVFARKKDINYWCFIICHIVWIWTNQNHIYVIKPMNNDVVSLSFLSRNQQYANYSIVS